MSRVAKAERMDRKSGRTAVTIERAFSWELRSPLLSRAGATRQCMDRKRQPGSIGAGGFACRRGNRIESHFRYCEGLRMPTP
jgi:hypothetical protein